MAWHSGRLSVGVVLVAATVSGCSLPDLPNWLGGDSGPTVSTTPAGAGALTGALAGNPGARDGMIVDPAAGCGTSNPFPQPNESIRWYGACADGKLVGQGTLVWYRGQRETERNEGRFVAGELHGEAITTYPDGRYIIGTYSNGQRDGDFVIHVGDGQHLRAEYRGGQLAAQEEMTPQQVADWRQQRATGAPTRVAEAPAGGSVAQHAGAPTTPRAAANDTDRNVSRTGITAATPASTPAAPAMYATANGTANGTANVADYRAQPQTPIPAMRESVREPVELAAAPLLVPSSGYLDPRWHSDTPSAAGIGSAAYYPSAPARVTQTAASPSRPAYAIPGSQIAQWIGAGTRPAPVPRTEPVPMPRTPTAQRPTPYQPAAMTPGAMPSTPAAGNSAADSLFSQAYRYERAGQTAQAAELYDQLLLTWPSAPSAMLASARLNYLRQGQSSGSTQQMALYADQNGVVETARGETARQVVPVNAPSPGNTLRPASLNPSLVADSPALYRTVCTRRDLYENNSGWCGVVTAVEPQAFRVEVRRIHLRGFGTVGITRSACTGNLFLNWFSRGTVVRVPQQCMTFQG
ncbi:MAG: hypothetical protein WD270_13455 [Acetobacterales bacterium]